MFKKVTILISLLLSFSLTFALSDSQMKIFEYEKKARKGDPTAQYKIGLIYEFGIETTKDIDSAIRWYKKADEQNVSRATLRLGVIYYDMQRYNVALPLIKKASDEEPSAFIYLGKNQLRMNKINEAEKYFKIAMDAEVPQAYFEYGVLFAEEKNNFYLAYVYTKLAQLKGYKKASSKNKLYKSKLSTNQIYSANDRIKRMK